MAVKKKPATRDEHNFKLLFPFQIKDAADMPDGEPEIIKIEGYANYAGNCDDDTACYIDRGNEVVVPAGVSVTNYKKNPVVLMNHDRSKVIGKTTSVTKKPDGIFITAEIHEGACDDEDFYAIKNGLVTSFSIGFRTLAGEFKEINKNDVYFITKSELYETSCVAIPCNAASGFNVVKSLDDGSFSAGDFTASPEVIPAELVTNKALGEDVVKIKLRDMLPEDKVKELESLGLGASLDEFQDVDTKSFLEALVSKTVAAQLKEALELLKDEQTKAAEAAAEEKRKSALPTDEDVLAAEVKAQQEADEKAAEEASKLAEDTEAIKSLSDTIATLKALAVAE